MTVQLTKEEQAMARGDRGPGVRRAMEILVKFTEAMGGDRLVRVASAHIMPKEPPELLRELTDGVTDAGASMVTLHPFMSAFSPVSWRKMGVPTAFGEEELARHEERLPSYEKCGFLQTFTCLPILVGNLPRKGQCVSWIGSGAQLLVNSLVGARCNRDGAVMTLVAAITGRAPRYGLFLDENRYGEVLVRFEGVDVSALTFTELGAVGYHVGALAGSRNVVMDGVPADFDFDRLKHLLAPMPVSGAVSLCHVVGVTPEAPTLEAALGGGEPSLTVVVRPEDIRRSLAGYAGDGSAQADLAIFGCPHCTVSEVKTLAGLLSGRTLASGKRLWIGMPYQHYALAQTMGYVAPIEAVGGVFASACMATIPDSPLPENVRVVATNSFKAAHYIARLTKGRVKVLVADMDRCVDAVCGATQKGGAA